MPVGGLLTVADIAERMERAPESVRRWIRDDRLPATRVGNVYLITLDDFRSFRPPVPRGRVTKSAGRTKREVYRAERRTETENARKTR
jgi:excisionase family DNA binding protein